jgi:hypothetical protein
MSSRSVVAKYHGSVHVLKLSIAGNNWSLKLLDSDSRGSAASTLVILDALGGARALLDERAGARTDARQDNGAAIALVAVELLDFADVG